MSVVLILVGVYCVYAGWHWKLMHRSWQDVARYKAQAKGRIPGYRQARKHHTSVALWWVVATVVLFIAIVH